MSEPIADPHAYVARAAVLAGVVGVAVVGISTAIGLMLGKPGGAHDIAMAGGLMLLAGLPGLVLAAVLAGRVRGGATIGFLAGMAIRMPVGAALATWGAGWGLAQTQGFSNWIAGAYLVLLVVEVLCLVPAVKKTAGICPQAASGGQPLPSQSLQESV